MSRIAAVLLAAGSSRRMGVNKLLLPAHGQAMVRRSAEVCHSAGLLPIIAVLGHEAALVEQALGGLPVQCAVNADFGSGMASSLIIGLAALPAETDAALICLGDMPLVTRQDVAALCAAFRADPAHPICIPVHAGQRGNPVLLGSKVFAALQGLSGEQGAKAYIRQHPELVAEVAASQGVLTDIDTPEAYNALS